jgi:hypothetical protein
MQTELLVSVWLSNPFHRVGGGQTVDVCAGMLDLMSDSHDLPPPPEYAQDWSAEDSGSLLAVPTKWFERGNWFAIANSAMHAIIL